MARPKKNTAQKLTHILPPVRITESEGAAIRARVAQTGLSLSEYRRNMLLSGEVVVQESRYDFQTMDQLRRIGVNLNQLAKVANATGEVPPALQTVCSKLDTVLDHFIENF